MNVRFIRPTLADSKCMSFSNMYVSYSKINQNESQTTSVRPLPHMFVIKDLIPVSIIVCLLDISLAVYGNDQGRPNTDWSEQWLTLIEGASI